MAGGVWQLHAPWLRADRPPGEFRGLGLSVPRLPVRRRGPRSPRTRADQSPDSALRLPVGQQDPDRRSGRRQGRGLRVEAEMSGTASTYVPKSRVAKWFESRLPIAGLVHSSFIAYPVPRNLNYFWTFGAILAAFLGIQIITGVWLAMHYEPSATGAFNSVEKIMRDVNYGWLLRYAHANGASMFFVAVYVHMFRALYYGSYKAPQQPGRHTDQVGQGCRALHTLRDGEGRVRHRGVHDPVRVVPVLHAELPRPCGQLHPGEPGGDARAHRAGMVLPALLRDPPRGSEQARRRHPDVLGGDHPGLRAVARHVADPLVQLPADLPAVHVGVPGRVPRPRLARLAAARGWLRARRAGLHRLLLRALPDRDAALRPVRDPETPPGSIVESVTGPGKQRRPRSRAEGRRHDGHDPRPLHDPRRRDGGPSPRRARAGRGCPWRPGAAAGELELRRHVRPLRRGAAAARLPGLQGSLLRLPFDEARLLPQSRAGRRPALLGLAGEGAGCLLSSEGRPQRFGRDVRPARPSGGFLPAALPERSGGRRSQWRQGAAGFLGDRQGADLLARQPDLPLRLAALRRLFGAGAGLHPRPSQRLQGGSEGLPSAGGWSLQPLLSGPHHRDAAAHFGRAGDLSEGRQRSAGGAGDGGSVRQGRLGLPDVGRRAAYDGPQGLGFRVILFLIVLSGLLYYVKKKIWADVGGEVHGLQPELHKAW
ncbi:hypothetical protein Lal_00041169 [Lupinus albus]|nr:hypothetical protein Lal_00041169 [Lupinus albus]